MSVPAGERKENKLEVFTKAKSLCKYTLQICTNEKAFEPKYQNALTNDLINISKDIFIYAWEANQIRVETIEDYKERLSLQNKSIRACIKLLSLMQIAQSVFHISSKRIKYWGGKTCESKELLTAWRNSDKKRYSNLQK